MALDLGLRINPNSIEENKKSKLYKVKIDEVKEYKYKDRFPEGNIEEHVESIKKHGIIVPIGVGLLNGEKIIYSGHTRYDAIKRIYEENKTLDEDKKTVITFNDLSLEENEIPIILRPVKDETELYDLFYESNRQRSLTPAQKQKIARDYILNYPGKIKEAKEGKGKLRDQLTEKFDVSGPILQEYLNERKEIEGNSNGQKKKTIKKSKTSDIVKRINSITKAFIKLNKNYLSEKEVDELTKSINKFKEVISEFEKV